jgi:hypothetical protein
VVHGTFALQRVHTTKASRKKRQAAKASNNDGNAVTGRFLAIIPVLFTILIFNDPQEVRLFTNNVFSVALYQKFKQSESKCCLMKTIGRMAVCPSHAR